MNDEIEFGTLEQVGPQRRKRPDQNRHYAVVAYGNPTADDLPIFVDIDVLHEWEQHAKSDLSVELGGVMLGGQYEDEQGQPFVLITDSLRAQHYENTHGSFKFTHDTWREISRQRDLLPDDLAMVGWYHTHPGWGVFLSGMDTFICDNFFNKRLDVALVIDPCQSDRGFFQWTARMDDGPRRTGGFYVIGSRFRKLEIESFVTRLESGSPMFEDAHLRVSRPGAPASQTPMANTQTAWFGTAISGILVLQFCLLALIAWRVLTPDPRADGQLIAAQKQLATERKVLDKIIGQLDIAPAGVTELIEKQRNENETLRATSLGLSTRVRTLQKQHDEATKAYKDLKKQFADLQQTVKKLKEANKGLETDLAAFEKKSADSKTEETTSWAVRLWNWRWYWGTALFVLACLGLIAVFGAVTQPSESSPDAGEGQQYNDVDSDEED